MWLSGRWAYGTIKGALVTIELALYEMLDPWGWI